MVSPEIVPERLVTPRFVLVVTVGLAYFMALGMLLPVVPLFVKHRLGGTDVAVGIAVGAFAVGAVTLRPFVGRIGDRLGRRMLIVSGSLVVAFAGVLYVVVSGVGAVNCGSPFGWHWRSRVLCGCRFDDHRSRSGTSSR